MPGGKQDYHARDPHFDGRYEGPIKDATGPAGGQMGIRSDFNMENLEQPKNPFHLSPKKDGELAAFQKMFDGR